MGNAGLDHWAIAICRLHHYIGHKAVVAFHGMDQAVGFFPASKKSAGKINWKYWQNRSRKAGQLTNRESWP